MNINLQTFQLTEAGQYFDKGTVEVTFRDQTRRLDAIRFRDGHRVLEVYGLVGRYQTGSKLWPGGATLWDNGNVTTHFGFNSNSGRHKKSSIVGFAGDFSEALISQR